jgi:thiol-disulfide isomerase/thioredoxin
MNRIVRWYQTVLLISASIFTIHHGICQEVKIGHKVPDGELINVINYPASTLRLSDFKERLIILDFWGTGCISCIEAFPEIDSMQKVFGRKIQIILINSQSKDSTIRFFQKHKKIKMPGVPFVTGDTLLSLLFPHKFLPHHVWIDGSSTVRFITNGYNTTFERITNFLEGKRIELREKNDVIVDPDKPLIADGNGRWLDEVEYYSYIMHQPYAQTNTTITPNQIHISSASIKTLYCMAFSKKHQYNLPQNTVILEVKDAFKYSYPKDANEFDEWARGNRYFYDLFVPTSKSDKLYQFMQQDLIRYFDAEGRIEKRKIKCLVLVRTTNHDKIRTKGGKTNTNLWSPDSLWHFRNYNLKDFVSQLQETFMDNPLPTPFIDGTQYKGNVDIEIDKNNLGSLSSLRSELKKYDLDLVEKDWVTDVLVIREKNYK